MHPLDRKLFRDLRRLGLQALALMLVMASGSAVLIIGSGASRSLERTAEAFYERYHFGDVFASLTRAPLHLESRITAIEGVASVELRILDAALLDIQGMHEPATGLLVSLPEHREPRVNQLYLRQGRLPESARRDEVAINERFARAHGFVPGDRFTALINGKQRTLRVTGVVLSPEFVYTIGPGDMVPDPRRFGVLYMPRGSLAAALDQQGAFNDVTLTLRRNANETQVLRSIDHLLDAYGGNGARLRKDQLSAAFVDGELQQLRAMAAVIPPVFLLVSAFLVNMILSRLVALEREQIGLLKALGYSSWAIAWHYVKLVGLIALLGSALGCVVGTWTGQALTRLYVEFYAFPFLLFDLSPDLYLLSVAVTMGAALVGAANAIRRSVSLPPAVAMQPPAPPSYRARATDAGATNPKFSRLDLMAYRHLVRWPVRTLLTVLGTSMSVALLVVALFTFDSIDVMIDTVFALGNRQHATLGFGQDTHPSAAIDVATWAGVMKVEPFRTTPVELRHGPRSKRLAIIGLPPNTRLARPLDIDLKPLQLPEVGIAVSEEVAQHLEVRMGDRVQITLLEESDREVSLPVTAMVRDYIGLPVYAHIDVLNGLLAGGPRLSGVHITLDPAALTVLYERVKVTPAIPVIALMRQALGNFRDTIEQNILYTISVYVTLAVVIAFGVIYNAARIQLSERARELASLRIFGFTRGEASRVLILELGAIVILAQPFGWLFGHALARLVTEGFRSDLYRLPFVIDLSTYAASSLIVIVASAVSLMIVRRRVDKLDMVRVLKTRE